MVFLIPEAPGTYPLHFTALLTSYVRTFREVHSIDRADGGHAAKSPQPFLPDSLRYTAQHRIYLTQHLCFPIPASSVVEEFRAAHFATVLDGFWGSLPVLLEGCLSAFLLLNHLRVMYNGAGVA